MERVLKARGGLLARGIFAVVSDDALENGCTR